MDGMRDTRTASLNPVSPADTEPKRGATFIENGKIYRDGYTIEKVCFASMPGHYVSGNLYRPIGRTGKLPAVLSPHGHWPGGRFFQRSDDEANRCRAPHQPSALERIVRACRISRTTAARDTIPLPQIALPALHMP